MVGVHVVRLFHCSALIESGFYRLGVWAIIDNCFDYKAGSWEVK